MMADYLCSGCMTTKVAYWHFFLCFCYWLGVIGSSECSFLPTLHGSLRLCLVPPPPGGSIRLPFRGFIKKVRNLFE